MTVVSCLRAVVRIHYLPSRLPLFSSKSLRHNIFHASLTGSRFCRGFAGHNRVLSIIYEAMGEGGAAVRETLIKAAVCNCVPAAQAAEKVENADPSRPERPLGITKMKGSEAGLKRRCDNPCNRFSGWNKRPELPAKQPRSGEMMLGVGVSPRYKRDKRRAAAAAAPVATQSLKPLRAIRKLVQSLPSCQLPEGRSVRNTNYERAKSENERNHETT